MEKIINRILKHILQYHDGRFRVNFFQKTCSASSPGAHNRALPSLANHRHQTKLGDGIADGIVSTALLNFPLHQRVTTPGDY
jgi:hypothetical protein